MTEPAIETADSTVDGFGMSVERMFADIWSRDVLSVKERRLILLGLLVGQGIDEQVEAELDTALRTGQLSECELREVVVFLTHYAGWTRGARLNTQVEDLIERVRQDRSDRRGHGG
jgi:4-carboxymuconolactone decarboxylase